MFDSFNKNEIVSSVKTTIDDRIGNIMYGTFVFSWCLWNWEAIYITFFIDQKIILDIYSQLKIIYILDQYPVDKTLLTVWTFVKLVFGPMLSTYIIIWPLSKIDFICSKKNINNKFKKEEELARKRNDLLKKQKSVLIEKEKNIKLEKEIVKDLSDEEKWKFEESDTRKDKAYDHLMRNFKNCIYSGNGFLSGNGKVPGLSRDQIAFLDLNELSEPDSVKRDAIKITQKGKYFLKKYFKDIA